VEQPNLTVRPIAGPEELDLFCQLPYGLNEELADDLATGRRRPEWLWVALRGDELLARVAWWARAGANVPSLLDILDLAGAPDRVDVGEHLLRTATAAVLPSGTPAEYSRFVPPDWRENGRQDVEDRMAVLARAGAKLFVERLRLEWNPTAPVPTPSGRLAFRTAGADELLAMMTQVLDGTLDAYSRRDLTHLSAREAAVSQYEDEFARYKSPRDWWHVATLPDGEPVGFVVPARNNYNPIIAYIAVLPAHRGNGYIDDLLAEGTRILAEEGVPRIRAATDLDNVPMAKAFQRAGYVNFERELVMTWS
jgi:RimJ/RimL family protein N-acetyltransferase